MADAMRFVFFSHSLVSDWNHGNAHFLRGVAAELLARGHAVRVYEPEDSWSRQHLIEEAGRGAVDAFHRAFPLLRSTVYATASMDMDEMLDGADVVVAHEWNSPVVLERLARHRSGGGRYRLLFHDTHHRAVSEPDALARLPLDGFDGVLAFGASLKAQYERLGWSRCVWVWHEAADTRVFRPFRQPPDGDLIWIGNWGDDERARELREFLIDPATRLGLKTRIHGVRYPEPIRNQLHSSGIELAGWLANYEVPQAFARYRVTVHVPRQPYVRLLPGIPTIRPFEALACGIPLVSAPWDDVEGLFRAGDDYVRVESGDEMTEALRDLLDNAPRREALAANGLRVIQARHTCAHRVDELLAIVGTPHHRLGTSDKMVADPARTVHGTSGSRGGAPPPPYDTRSEDHNGAQSAPAGGASSGSFIGQG